jgi:YD repeat-containing protein
VKLGYDAAGRLVSLTDGRGKVTRWQRDLQGRIVGKYTADSVKTFYGYDSAGREIERTDALGQKRLIGEAGRINLYAYVGGNPVNWIDPLGLASCTYSIVEHKMTCVSNDGKTTRTISGDSIFSGRNHYQIACQNNPECAGIEDFGPIPPGTYRMNHDEREGNEYFWRLEPDPQKSWWQCTFGSGAEGRCGFMFHPGTVSNGCITVNSFDDKAMRRYLAVHELLLREEGTNILTVVP